MKLLWTTNTLPPQLAGRLGHKVAGHWMWGLLDILLPELEAVTVITEQEGVASAEFVDGKLRVIVVGTPKPLAKWIPASRCSDAFMEHVRQVNCDVLHVHGTEHPYALSCRQVKPGTPLVLSIQGLIGPYARYMQGMLGNWESLWVNGLVAAARGTSPLGMRFAFGHAAASERANIYAASMVLCRTTWDRGHVLAMRPGVNVAYASEAIRPAFTDSIWRGHADRTKAPRLLFTNGAAPVKNVMELLEAVAVLVRRGYAPQLRLAGFASSRGGYLRSLQQRAKMLGLEGRVIFMGHLSALEMVTEMLEADVYVSASLIDNSPNSICEAQLVGIPVVASAVGGVVDIVQHEHTGLLYQVGEYQQLAECVARLSDDTVFAAKLSEAARKVARERHDTSAIRTQYLSAYESLARGGQIERTGKS